MKQNIKIGNFEKETDKKIKQAKSSALLVFSLCVALISLLLFIEGDEAKAEKSESELVSVFKETGIYEFLDLDECQEENAEGSV